MFVFSARAGLFNCQSILEQAMGAALADVTAFLEPVVDWISYLTASSFKVEIFYSPHPEGYLGVNSQWTDSSLQVALGKSHRCASWLWWIGPSHHSPHLLNDAQETHREADTATNIWLLTLSIVLSPIQSLQPFILQVLFVRVANESGWNVGKWNALYKSTTARHSQAPWREFLLANHDAHFKKATFVLSLRSASPHISISLAWRAQVATTCPLCSSTLARTQKHKILLLYKHTKTRARIQ